MKTSELPSMTVCSDSAEQGRLAVLKHFTVEAIQRMTVDDLLAAQSLAGHGDLWGRWQTPKSIAPSKIDPGLRDINIALRLRSYLAKEPMTTECVDQLVEEGVLALTRLALLTRLISTGSYGYRMTRRLKLSTITTYLFTYWPLIAARAIRRKAEGSDMVGLLQCLTKEDLREFRANKQSRIELDRLESLVARGVWSDIPCPQDIAHITDPSEEPIVRPPQGKPEPYLPLLDDWLAKIGPRVLWVVRDMGPNLLHLLESLTQELKNINWAIRAQNLGQQQVSPCIQSHLKHFPWCDRDGHPLLPPFRLVTSYGKQGADTLEWPPRTWEQIVNLSITLQTAHLFIALLICGGRVGEVTTLVRGCVQVGRDGKDYLKGVSYKLSGNLFGEVRQWPAPEILCQSLGQQSRLAAAMDWLPRRLQDGLPQTPRFGNALWVSLGAGGAVGENAEIRINQSLSQFAIRLDMDPKPGGRNVHAHRFRKSIGRLAGVTLFNSPLVLKRLFGHKSIEMTLHYILSDSGVREEAEKVLREMRIMHCAEALEEIHHALQHEQPLPGNGGPGAARLVTAVANEEKRLEQSSRVWGEGSAYDLAYLLTAQGMGWRLIKENIVCSKAPGEDGLCQKKRSKGEPNTANCQPECGNRIVFEHKRRDTELKIEQYLDIARQARDDGQLLVLASVMDNAQEEWASFPELEQKYRADPEVQALLAACEEPEAIEEGV